MHTNDTCRYILIKYVRERESERPEREPVFESITTDGIPSDNRSEKPIKRKPKL